MGIDDKFDELKGSAKEKYGDATDNERLQAEGQAEKTGAKIKDAAGDAKDYIGDKFSDAKDALGDAKDDMRR